VVLCRDAATGAVAGGDDFSFSLDLPVSLRMNEEKPPDDLIFDEGTFDSTLLGIGIGDPGTRLGSDDDGLRLR
jgi:hypothetical protein